MIDGLVIKQLKQVADDRGWLVEIMRSDWEQFQKFGQVYVTAAYQHVAKAWHMHKKQTDNITCIKGMIKLVLYDGRENSKTKKEINEFTIGERNLLTVRIPPEVWHGFKTITEEYALILNVPTELYDYKEPDEYRLPPDTKEIPYDWKLAPWLKHG